MPANKTSVLKSPFERPEQAVRLGRPEGQAPGRKNRTNKDGTLRVYWVASTEARAAGYQPETVRIHSSDDGDIARRCCELQKEMRDWLAYRPDLNWQHQANRLRPKPGHKMRLPRRVRASHELISHKRLMEVVSYDPERGIFTWLVTLSPTAQAGCQAGHTHPVHGYVNISIDGERYFGHRLAWFYVHGVWPENLIDHIDRTRDNNRLANLREATHLENASNREGARYGDYRKHSADKPILSRRPITPVLVQESRS